MSPAVLLATTLMLALSDPAGQVTAVSGPAQLVRQEQRYRLEPGSGVAPGDTVSTGQGGSLALHLDAEHVLYLGPGSTVALGRGAETWSFRLDQGEARVVAGSDLGMSIVAGPSATRIRRGVVRIRRDADGLAFQVEVGEAEVTPQNAALARLGPGQRLTLGPDGTPIAQEPGSPRVWSIQPDALHLDAAAEASRRRKLEHVETANDDAATAYEGDEGPMPPTPPEGRGPEPPPATADDAQRGTNAPDAGDAGEPQSYKSTAIEQFGATSSISLALGSSTNSTGFASSGALFSDAQQDTLNPIFPGNIYLVTAQSRYTLADVRLRTTDIFPTAREYWSIGVGPPPTSQVLTTFRTGSNPVPDTIRIPRFDAYLVKFPASQYGIPDPTTPAAAGSTLGIAGLLGVPPVAPQVQNATPLLDDRAQFNEGATFAIGEFALQRSFDRVGKKGQLVQNPTIDVRRSDQDRTIIKSPTGNDNLDKVQANPEVIFTGKPDPQFFPELPKVAVPVALTRAPEYGKLDLLRKAATTTLMADQLYDYGKRTGQTRFTLDGKSVVDITGYQRGGKGVRPLDPAGRDLLRGGNLRAAGAGAGGRGGAGRGVQSRR